MRCVVFSIAASVAVTAAVEPPKSEDPCCQGACKQAGMQKYWSIAKSESGIRHCGECCMDPRTYPIFHVFEPNLTKSDSDTPCTDFGFARYDSTVTHGFGPLKITLDLYDLPAEKVRETVEVTTNSVPCCQGACEQAGMQKYWSIAKSIFGKSHCGECCMDPRKFKLYHFFEKNLTRADSATPCKDFGYASYDSTVTHGFGPVKMTLDLYDLAADTHENETLVI